MINEKQTTTNQSLCSIEKIDFKKKIVSTVNAKNLMKQEIRKNEGIHVSSDFEKLNKLKNRIQRMLERLSMSENILNKYDN